MKLEKRRTSGKTLWTHSIMCPKAISSGGDEGFFIRTNKGDHQKFVFNQQDTVENVKVDGNSRDNEHEPLKEEPQTLSLQLGCLLIPVSFRILLTVALWKEGLSPWRRRCAGTGKGRVADGKSPRALLASLGLERLQGRRKAVST